MLLVSKLLRSDALGADGPSIKTETFQSGDFEFLNGVKMLTKFLA